MSRDVQIAIDCKDPHALNRFWAELMEYEPEDHHEQVTELLAAGHVTEDETITIDGRLDFRAAAASSDPGGTGPRLLFQQVPEDKQVKNRVHLDVRAGDDRDAVVARCLELGATKLWDGQQGPHTWVTMADPEGNEFCVS
jgi:Glyoxalase-like domain